MKKILLLFAAVIINITAFAQTSLGDIPYTSTDANFSGKTLAIPTDSFTCAAGTGIYVYNQSYTGTDYWDLSSYDAIDISLSCATASVGQSFTVRFVMVGSDPSAATSILKTCTFDSGTQTVTLNFTDDASPTKKLWAIKIPWDGTTGFSVKVNSINAVSSSSGVTTTTIDDPNKIVNVYNLSGVMLRKAIKQSEATKGLEKGFYIVDHKKVFVLNE